MTKLRIKSIKKLDKLNDRYDLTVNATHNFYANGILIHNTSFRTSYTKVLKDSVTRWNRIKRYFKLPYDTQETETWEVVTGTRRVVLSNQDIDKEGFHGPESYRFEVSEALKPYLVKGQTIYGEIVGYVNGKSIMPNHDMTKFSDKAYTKKYGKNIAYSYGCKENEYKFLVYRITYTTESGDSIDFTPEQLKDWCDFRGFMSPMILADFIYDGDEEKLVTLVKNLAERPEVLCEDYYDRSHINEGVVIRVENGRTTPQFYKHKSFVFKVLEGIAKESGEVDIEESNSIE